MIPIDQRKADMSDPDQHAAWAMSVVPMGEGRPAMILPAPLLPGISRHLWDAGFRHHPELQTIRQESDESVALAQAGVSWVPCDGAPESEGVPEVDLSDLSDEQAAAVAAALERREATR